MTDMEMDLMLALAENKRLKAENEALKKTIEMLKGKLADGDLNG